MPDIAALLEATRKLTSKVDLLGNKLQISQQQADRTRRLVIVVTVLTILSFCVAATNIYLFRQVHDAQAETKNSQVIGCQNANEARTANLALWNFLIDASLAQQTQNAASKKLLKQLRDYITVLYAQHDCSELTKKYPLPKAPPITQLG